MTNELKEAAQLALTVAKEKIEEAMQYPNGIAIRHLLGAAWDEVARVEKSLASSATTNEAAAQADGLTTWQAGVLSKLPPLDVSWPAEVQDGWMRCMSAVRAALATQPVQAQGEAISPDDDRLWSAQAAAIRTVMSMGYTWDGGERWTAPAVDRGLSEAQEREAFEAWWTRRVTESPFTMHSEAAWRAWQARAASAPSQAEPKPCRSFECRAAKADGVLCANDECDIAAGHRQAPSQAGSCQASDDFPMPRVIPDEGRFGAQSALYHMTEAQVRAYAAEVVAWVAAPPAGRTLTDDEITAGFQSMRGESGLPSIWFHAGARWAAKTLAASSTTAGERE